MFRSSSGIIIRYMLKMTTGALGDMNPGTETTTRRKETQAGSRPLTCPDNTRRHCSSPRAGAILCSVWGPQFVVCSPLRDTIRPTPRLVASTAPTGPGWLQHPRPAARNPGLVAASTRRHNQPRGWLQHPLVTSDRVKVTLSDYKNGLEPLLAMISKLAILPRGGKTQMLGGHFHNDVS
jgi:hypothetical protein